jgi:hypothetical protein
LRKNPYKPDSYRLFRKLYTEVKRADAAWCLCQALTCMNRRSPTRSASSAHAGRGRAAAQIA